MLVKDPCFLVQYLAGMDYPVKYSDERLKWTPGMDP